MILLLLLALILPVVSANENLSINTTTKGDVIVQELTNPAIFTLEITNNGFGETYELYSLVGVTMTPRNPIYFAPGKNILEIRAYPNEDVRKISGPFLFEYQLKGEQSGISRERLMINILPLTDVLEVSGENILPKDNEITIKVKNTRNAFIEGLDVEFESAFFPDFEEKISLNPFEESLIHMKIDEDKMRKLRAGPYVITAKIDGDKKKRVEGIINYLEREGIAVEQTTSGFIIRKTTTTKTNLGNKETLVQFEGRRDILSRLFTGHSIAPIESDRSGIFVEYIWEQHLQPGESYSITSTTNYTFPFIIIILIILVGVAAKTYSKTPLTINKHVSYVKTKGGEFALKVTLHLKSNKNLHSIKLSDSIPHSTKLYQGYGRAPDSIDESSRRVSWNIGSLNAGEERVFSYVIYSKIKVLGRFELPMASASYLLGDKQESVFSNRTYFVAESTSLEN